MDKTKIEAVEIHSLKIRYRERLGEWKNWINWEPVIQRQSTNKETGETTNVIKSNPQSAVIRAKSVEKLKEKICSLIDAYFGIEFETENDKPQSTNKEI